MKRHLSSNFVCIFFYISCLLFSSLLTDVGGLGTSSTIAIAYGSSRTVCGILAGNSLQSIQCNRNGETFSVLPNVSYEAISGGKDFLCGLTSGGVGLFCWDSSFRPKRIYHDPASPLTALAVGVDRVCALQAKLGTLICWNRETSVLSLPEGAVSFDSITSGDGFSCGIVKDDDRNVVCWGENGTGDFIESEFGNMSMLTLSAGKSHVCGISMSGVLICHGSNGSGQLEIPSRAAFYYSDLALGGNYTCALQRSNGLVVCWGGVTVSHKIKRLLFETIVSGVDFMCGLTSETLTIGCWGSGWSGKFMFSVPLPRMIPGPCVHESCQICGVLPDSKSLCSGETSICRSCVVDLPLGLDPRAKFHTTRTSKVAQPVQPPMTSPSLPLEKKKRRPFWAYEIFGTIGILSGLYALGYFIYLKRFRSSSSDVRAEDIVKYKEINSIGSNINADTAFIASLGSSAPQSRSSSITQISSLTLGGQRSSNNSSKHVGRAEKFTLYELALATRNFSVENRIGKGSSGTVYKGNLANGREVAIKREEIRAGDEKECAFESELSLLSRVHHKHLVGLIGFCEENNERALVYDCMSNGALYDHLHNKNNTQKSSSPLNSWKLRIKIALDAARGIEYLHNYAVPPIIHRDIKSSNILLDSKWVARVSDFGLSLKSPSEGHEGSMAIKAVGTVGYIDPEYYVLKVLTTKSDVYGFGVVMLELLTGKRAIFKEVEGGGTTGVVDFAGSLIVAGEVWKVLDKRVEQPVLNEFEAVEILAYTAMMCVNLEGKERPAMSDVVSKLEKALALTRGSSGTLSPTLYSFS